MEETSHNHCEFVSVLGNDDDDDVYKVVIVVQMIDTNQRISFMCIHTSRS